MWYATQVLRQHVCRVEHVERKYMTVADGEACVSHTHSVLDSNLALHGTLTKGNPVVPNCNSVYSRRLYCCYLHA